MYTNICMLKNWAVIINNPVLSLFRNWDSPFYNLNIHKFMYTDICMLKNWAVTINNSVLSLFRNWDSPVLKFEYPQIYVYWYLHAEKLTSNYQQSGTFVDSYWDSPVLQCERPQMYTAFCLFRFTVLTFLMRLAFSSCSVYYTYGHWKYYIQRRFTCYEATTSADIWQSISHSNKNVSMGFSLPALSIWLLL